MSNAFLDWLLEQPDAASRIADAIRTASRAAGHQDADRYLRAHGYRREKFIKGDQIIDPDLTRTVLATLGLEFEWDARAKPWSLISKNKRIHILLGSRSFALPEVSATASQHAVHELDTLAMSRLSNALQTMGQNWHIDVHVLRAELPDSEATPKLDALLADQTTGAIFCLGSPVTNPLSNVLAARIWRGRRAPFPLKFRWRFAMDGYLNAENHGLPEGIYADQALCVQRDTEDDALKLTREALDGGRIARDCGIIALRCGADEPVVAVLAGHGAFGTLGCVELLTAEPAAVDRSLKDGVLVRAISVDKEKQVSDDYRLGHLDWVT